MASSTTSGKTTKATQPISTIAQMYALPANVTLRVTGEGQSIDNLSSGTRIDRDAIMTIEDTISVTSSHIDTFISQMLKDMQDKYDDYVSNLDDFAYDGFDPVEWRHWLIGVLISKNHSLDDVIKMIFQCLAFISLRGVKIKGKLKPKAIEVLRTLKEKMGLNVNPTSGAPPKNAVTLNRIAACFAVQLSMVQARTLRVVGKKPEKLHPAFCHPNVLSFVPFYFTKKSAFIIAYKAWRRSFTETVGNYNKNMTQAQIDASIERFDDTIANSKLMKNEVERWNAFIHVLRTIATEDPDGFEPMKEMFNELEVNEMRSKNPLWDSAF